MTRCAVCLMSGTFADNLVLLIGTPITDPHYWHSDEECNLDSLKHVFRSCTEEEMPLLQERLDCLKEASQVLYEVSRLFHCIESYRTDGHHSALQLLPHQPHLRRRRLRSRPRQPPSPRLPLLPRRAPLRGRRPNQDCPPSQARPDPRRRRLGLLQRRVVGCVPRHRQHHHVRRLPRAPDPRLVLGAVLQPRGCRRD